jgi:hypothetical protein
MGKTARPLHPLVTLRTPSITTLSLVRFILHSTYDWSIDCLSIRMVLFQFEGSSNEELEFEGVKFSEYRWQYP